jgi:phosphatidylglycerophosphate synthase
MGLLTWVLWTAAAYVLRGDDLCWFVFGSDSMWTQVVAVIGAFVLPPTLAMTVSHWCAQPHRGMDAKAESPNRNTFWSAVGTQARFVVPTVFAAVGISRWREGGTQKAAEWLAVAITALIIEIALLCWANAGRAEDLRANQPLSRSSRRRAALQVWCVSVAVMLMLPALVVGLAQRWRLDDDPRMMVYAGGLVATVILVKVTERLLRRSVVQQQPESRTASGRPATPPLSTGEKAALYAQPLVVGVAAFIACRLFDFPFELTRGDEGWGLLLMSFFVAVLQVLPHWLRRKPEQPGIAEPKH